MAVKWTAMLSPFHNYTVFAIAVMFVFFFDQAYTFMGVYNFGWDHERNKDYMNAVINRDVSYPIFYSSLIVILLGASYFLWKRTYREFHYVWWAFLGFLATNYIGWVFLLAA